MLKRQEMDRHVLHSLPTTITMSDDNESVPYARPCLTRTKLRI